MKSPDGYNRLKELAFSMQPGAPTVSEFFHDTADLTRDLGEALHDVCRNGNAHEINWLKANEILDKYSEWK